ncbi:hypothetical protein TNCT_502531 [Trichonephila clavata]|uniref:Uncharacterized protein n=1 Tax=Trichonephila clavata TaxID=2740835 RepID=A0A8X6JCT8_TRICU|nr:hypothetical protein TNCT_502531 [Trichonephila clavata]
MNARFYGNGVYYVLHNDSTNKEKVTLDGFCRQHPTFSIPFVILGTFSMSERMEAFVRNTKLDVQKLIKEINGEDPIEGLERIKVSG